MKTDFLFFVADHLLVGQLCTNSKSDSSLLSCLKVTQCSMSEIGDAPLYNSCSLLIQVMTTGPLPAPSKCKSGWFNGWGHSSIHQTTFWRWWSESPRPRTSCYLTSSKSAWKSTPKCTWICWRVWWSPGAIRWPVGGPGCGSRIDAGPQVQRDPGLVSEGVLRLCTLLSLAPPLPPTWTRWTTSFGHTSRTSPTWLLTTPKPTWSLPSTEYSPSSCRHMWKRYALSSGSISRWWLRLKVATLNRCQLYYIIKLPDLIFSIKVLK